VASGPAAAAVYSAPAAPTLGTPLHWRTAANGRPIAGTSEGRYRRFEERREEDEE
jgi:hypothetical protein